MIKPLWRTLEVLAWALFFAFAALILALRYWLLPDIARHREAIVASVAATIGQPVKIGGIEAGWLGLRPRINLSDVRIYDADGREALVLPSIENILSWRSLLHGELRLHSVVIDAPRLSVRRDASGAFHVAGIKLARGEGGSGFTDWLLAQQEIEIRNAEIEWRDQKRSAPPLAFSAVSLRLRNEGERHAIGVAARPPANLGSSLEVRAELGGRSAAEANAWSGRVYAELGYTDLAAWRPWLEYPFELSHGQGALRVWAAVDHGAVRSATADVALSEVHARLADGLAPLELSSVRGRLRGRVLSEGYEVSGRQLALVDARGPRMQPTDFQLSWKRAGEPGESGSATANAVEFAPLAHLLESLPFPPALRKLVAELQPSGQLADARYDWQGSIAAPARFTAKARFAELGLRPWGAVPGFSGLAGTIEANEQRGRLYLQSRHAEVELPRVFPEPRIAFDTLNAQVDWESVAGVLNVRLASASFANADLAGSAFGSYAPLAEGPGRLDLSASLTRADGKRIVRYLPLASLMGDRTRAWLADAVLAGEARDVHLRLRGDLRDFPFADPATGQFQVTARVENGLLDYVPGWPRIEGIDGDLLFERDRMEIVGRRGAILGARLENVRVSLPGLRSPEPVVLVTGRAEGPTSEFLRYLADSPLRARMGGLTEFVSATGEGRLSLKLELPLKNLPASRASGEYELIANTVVVHRALPALERAAGKIGFSESGFALQDIRARIFGGNVSLSGGSRAGAGVEVVARGDATVGALAALAEHPAWRHLSGGASYVATVALRDNAARVTVESPLRGLASALPQPLEKEAASSLPLRVDFVLAEGGARDRTSISLGRITAAEILRLRRGDAMQVQRAAVALTPAAGQPVSLPERPGVLVYGALPALDLDRWRALLPAGAKAGAEADPLPTTIDVKLDRVQAYGKRINKLAVRGRAAGGAWSATVDADEIAGELAYGAGGSGRFTARLLHLSVPQEGSAGNGAMAKPGDLPAIDLVAERFAIRGKQLGRVELAARNDGSDWRIDKLAMTNADATFRGQGVWHGGKRTSAELDFSLDATDTGRLLARLGHPDLVLGGKTRFEGALAWQGDLLAVDYASLSGNLSLQASDAQFLEIEPGLGKLVSLMSLQALPRRVTLDFRDVFSKGFRFDRIDAASQVERGVMSIDQFHMRGSAAEVDMSGTVDLARETQDLRVRVVPSLGDSASTVMTIVNPLAGVAAAIAQRMLKNPLGQMFSYDYQVSGSWADPKVAKLEVLRPQTEMPSP